MDRPAARTSRVASGGRVGARHELPRWRCGTAAFRPRSFPRRSTYAELSSILNGGSVHQAEPTPTSNKEPPAMDVHVDISLLQPVIALIAGLLILVVPRLLNYVVALYLILLGLSGLWPHLMR